MRRMGRRWEKEGMRKEKKEDEMSREEKKGDERGESHGLSKYSDSEEPRSWSVVMSELDACFQVFPLKTSTD